MPDDLDEALARLRQQVSSLRRDMHVKADKADLDQVRDDLSRRRAEIEEIDRRLDDVDEAADDLRRSLTRRIDTAVEQVQQQVFWIERHARASDGARVADLDTMPELVTAAARAARGASLEAELLSDGTRATLQQAVATRDRWEADYRRSTTEVLAASRTIAGDEPGSVRRRTAVRDFRRATARIQDLRRVRAGVVRSATDASARLSVDDARKTDRRSAIDEGRRADAELRERIAVRIDEMIDRAELPPVWFAVVLGLGPSSDATTWTDLGTDLVAYRLTYSVADPVRPLGDEPDSDASPRRTQWHRSLSARLDRLDRLG